MLVVFVSAIFVGIICILEAQSDEVADKWLRFDKVQMESHFEQHDLFRKPNVGSCFNLCSGYSANYNAICYRSRTVSKGNLESVDCKQIETAFLVALTNLWLIRLTWIRIHASLLQSRCFCGFYSPKDNFGQPSYNSYGTVFIKSPGWFYCVSPCVSDGILRPWIIWIIF